MRGDFRSLAMVGTGAMVSFLRHAAAGNRPELDHPKTGGQLRQNRLVNFP
jgi:hypothetical protein